MLKTCGTTRLLEAIPRTLQAALSRSGLLPCRVKYSRASFLFPDAQPAPHHDFGAETATLRRHFGHLAASSGGVGDKESGKGGTGGGGGGAYVLGDALSGLQWHVFVADASAAAAAAEAAAALLAAEESADASAAAVVSSSSSSSAADAAAAAAALLLSGAPSRLVAAAAGGAANATAAALAGRASRRGAGGSGPPLLRGVENAAAGAASSSSPTYTLEVCMMGLDPARAALFSRGSGAGDGEKESGGNDNFVGAAAVTAASGLRALLPSALVDDFVFDPCGYSMNALDGSAFATVHVTPEEACSYASLELCGYCPEALCPSAVVARAAAIFGPRRMAVAMSVDADVAFCPWLLSSLSFPAGYGFDGAAAQDFGGRGRTAFYCLVKQEEDTEGESEESEGEEEVGLGAAADAASASAASTPAHAVATAAFVASPPPGSTACGVAVKAAAAAAAAAANGASGGDESDAAAAAAAAAVAAPPSAASSPLSPLSRPPTGDSDDNDGGEELLAAPPAEAASAAAGSPRGPLRLSPSLFSTTSSMAAALAAAEGGGSESAGSGDDEREAATRSSVEAAAALLAAAAIDDRRAGSSDDEELLLQKDSASLQLPSPPRPARTPSPVAQVPPPPRAPTPANASAAAASASAAASESANSKKKKAKKTLPSVPFASSSSRPSHHPPRPFLPRCASAAALATLLEPRAPSAAGGASAALVPAVVVERRGASNGALDGSGGTSLAAAPRRPPAPAPLPAVLAASRAARLPCGDEASLHACLASAIEAHALEDNVYAVDLGAVARAHAAWQAAMPRVEPFYAVKCNPDPAIVATLAALGAGFDCASAAEVELVLSLGVRPHRVVFANACKRPADVRAAAASGVDLTTFDTSGELRKLAALHPGTGALLRLRADDQGARCQLGNKYGAEPGEAARVLLREARRLGVRVVGVSFHVGSGASDPAAFAAAIGLAREAFDDGLALGFEMDLLDIGGGFAAPTAIGSGGGGEGEEEGADVDDGASSGSDDAGDGNSNHRRPRRHKRRSRHHFATASTTDATSDSAPPSLMEVSFDAATGHTCVPALGLDLGPAPAAVNAALEQHFPAGCGVRVIAEPGRYYAEGAATLACAVYGSRDGKSPCACGCGVEQKTRDYWITDGLYGSMNCVLYDHATLSCKKLEFASTSASSSASSGRKVLGFAARPPAFDGDSSDEEEGEGGGIGAESVSNSGASTPPGGASSPSSASAPVPPATPPPSAPGSSAPSSPACSAKNLPEGLLLSTVFGPTCDGLDTVLRDEPLPRLRAGRDWLAFPRMGAYTLAGASAFNGFDATAPAVVYVWSERG